MAPKTSCISVTDQFCGAGGSSTGAKMVAGIEVLLAMNHWDLAIETHNTNHPDTTHVLADISQVDPRRYPSTDILITSPECTNHSLAKGKRRKGLAQLPLWGDGNHLDPAEERSRATMWDVPRFAEFHDYRVVIVENVIDARRWRLWDAWLHAMQCLDYEWEVVYFNSMFAPPTPQSRDRMYVVFWKRGNQKPDLDIRPRAYCDVCEREIRAVQSWTPGKPKWGRYQRQYVYLCPHCASEVKPAFSPAWTAIDWSLPAPRIGERERPLKPRTLERIRYGIEKYSQPVAIPTSHSHGGPNRAHPLDGTLPTQTTRQTLGLAVLPFLLSYYTRTSAHSPLDEPVPTVSTENRHALITPPFMIELRGTGKARGLDHPLSTVTAGGNHHGLVCPPFLASYYGSHNSRPVTEAMGTVTTRDRHALVQPAETLDVEDCGFRMVQPHEIQAAMAFPSDYVVLGAKRDQVRQLGNAVTPPVMQLLVERCAASLGA